jgi:hypothetical protein
MLEHSIFRLFVPDDNGRPTLQKEMVKSFFDLLDLLMLSFLPLLPLSRHSVGGGK